MVKDREDLHGLQTTNLENLIFKIGVIKEQSKAHARKLGLNLFQSQRQNEKSVHSYSNQCCQTQKMRTAMKPGTDEYKGVARIFQRGAHTGSYRGYSPDCHLNIVGCLLTKRLTKGGSRAHQDSPPPFPPGYALGVSTNIPTFVHHSEQKNNQERV